LGQAWSPVGTGEDLEILLLHQQLVILHRQLSQPVCRSRLEKLMLAVVIVKLKAMTKQSTSQLREVLRLLQPETVLKWHRELVRRKWTLRQGHRGGRGAARLRSKR
jgi:hypothetical protein